MPHPSAGRLSLVIALLFCVLGGQETRRVSIYLTDKAEARRAASAQADFPSRRAREKAVPEEVNGI